MAGIYVHIPFCRQACNYCNFYFSTSMGNKDKWLEALLHEIELTQNYLQGEAIETLYFGGGTPSLLQVEELQRIVDRLAQYHNLNGLKEFTLEANPDDLSESKVKQLEALKPYGFNRFSIGVQSFFDEDLQYMNRAHNADEAVTSIRRVQDAGFDKITIDLIYGTPTLGNERWKENLERTFALNLPHISSYALTVEPKTALEKHILAGKTKAVSEEQSAIQFKMLMQEMRANGYQQYEISNFCRIAETGKPAPYALHNTNYWKGKMYLGLGPSAHSFNGNSRRWNVSNNLTYIQSIGKKELPFEEEVLTEAQKINERIMTSLRTIWGLQLTDLGTAALAVKESLSEIDPAHYHLADEVLTLTEEGKLFADTIAAELFVES